MTRSLHIFLFTLMLGLLSCRGEPDLNCERVRFGWPHFDVGPASDTSSAEGIQIDIPVRSDLLPGASAKLTITAETVPEEEQEAVFAGEAQADENGLLVFEDVTVPIGSILFLVDGSDSCGSARSGRRTFVWDELGKPKCEVGVVSGPAADPSTGVFDLTSEHDEDVATAGMQVSIAVAPGRSDMEVTLFVVDRETGDKQTVELPLGDDDLGLQSLTLAEGEQAVRAVCYWPGPDLHAQVGATH
jgi:hypothetical protein